MISFDLEIFKSISEKVFNCDSPSGYNHNIIKLFGLNRKISLIL